MERNEMPPPGFDAEQFARVTHAAQVLGKDPIAFVRDAALAAANDPFLKALEQAGDTVQRLAPVFDDAEDSPVRPVRGQGWPDAPLGSRDLAEPQQGHAA
ncbi:hypothetical protein AB0O57_29120 [Streptomyces sp. NPDC091201]|uniref:hypothetical protein n=1 Tax=Streptomyces sp. NPDC091201 TaxID=3155190 RepID=UPI00343EB444